MHFWQHAGLGPWKICDKTVRGRPSARWLPFALQADARASLQALGHESGGEVIAVGEGVTNVKVGDRVAIEPGVPCGKATCNFCLTGQYNLCPTVDL